ncbi:MFS transporter [Aureibacillus halotolerans]|uniref:DHA2 family metal-tetracycline-proton antiporter-like MFS transporter n=1 Tax=Aureibacillus halotolerans TaxID=1508390 RepID=A0A4R6U3M5_9BACI|nr:MFS transporter [Aureibacillus halotolerans]TDQ41078.1 DHA2 family metal-tetracycline-proton antiporter-like MFS transporter [Aureibacillus halotolerans]
MPSTKNTERPVMNEGLVTLLISITLVFVVMNTMMFNIALPSIATEFAVSEATASWLVTGYSIVFAISSITYSRLSDFIPIRRLLAISMSIVSLAAIVGLFSHSFFVLMGVRIVQAAGAGAIPALGLILVSRFIPTGRRGKAMAAVMAAVSLGLGLGPVVGGIIVEFAGWNTLFGVTAIILLLVPFVYKQIPAETPVKGSFDVMGALFIGVGTTCVLLFLTTQVWLAFLIGVVSLLLFVWRIRTVKEPFVEPTLFRHRRFLLLSAVGIAAYLCNFATLFLLPQLLHHSHNLSASSAGLIIFPGSLLAMIISNRIGKWIDNRGNEQILSYMPWIPLVAMVLFASFAAESFVAVLLIYMLMSLGITALNSSVSNEMSRVLEARQIGTGMGLFQLLQFFSGAFGVAVTASALTWQKELTLSVAYSNIFWGMAVVALLSIVLAMGYRRATAIHVKQSRHGA